METASLPKTVVADFYRFALLLAGEAKAAERALAQALAEMEAERGGLRSVPCQNAWVIARLRQLCAAETTAPLPEEAPRLLRAEADDFLEIEAFIFAQRFHRLPEPDRSALAVFYLDLLSPDDAAKLFGMPLETWCAILGRARATLRETIAAAENRAPASAAV